jgi:hypothetical protein
MLAWILLGFFAALSKLTGRCSPFDMTLPLSARTLWISHMIALLFSTLVLMAVVLLFLVFGHFHKGAYPARASVNYMPLYMMVGFFLALSLIQNLRPSLNEIPFNWRTVTTSVLIWFGTLAIMLTLHSLPLYYLLLPVVATFLLGWKVYRSLPDSFVMIPTEAATEGDSPLPSEKMEERIEDEVFTGAGGAGGWPVHKIVIGTLYQQWLALLIFPLLMFLGYYVSGFYPEDLSGPVWIVMLWTFLPGLHIYPITRLRMIDHLPISRRIVFPYLVVPGLLAVYSTLTLGTVVGNVLSLRAPLAEYQEMDDAPCCRRVPDSFLEIAWDGEPPRLTAPWGETHESWTVPVVRGRKMVMYSPFAVPAGGSSEFAALQVSRAVETIYGADIKPEEIKSLYLAIGAAGRFELENGGQKLRKDYPNLRATGWIRTLPVTLLIIGLPWFLFLTLIVRGYYAGVRESLSIVAAILPAFLPMVFLVLLIWLGELGYTQSWKLTAFASILIRKVADSIPGPAPVIWILSLILLAGAYLFCQSQFLRIEVPFKREERCGS